MVDRLGYVHDAIDEAERLAGSQGSEVVLLQRRGYPVRSLYAIAPANPAQPRDLVPFSVPGLDRRKVQVVEMRYFGGLSVEETAEVLKVSTVTVKRDWRAARLWLYRELTGGNHGTPAMETG